MKSHWRKPGIHMEGELSVERRAYALAARLDAKGCSRLRLRPACGERLQCMLRRADSLSREGVECEALARLQAASRHIEACLADLRAEPGLRLPGKPVPRVLSLARCLLMGGEQALDKDKLLTGIAAFDSSCSLRMRELECLPAALKIAFCEAAEALAGEILRIGGEYRQAMRWVERGGRVPRGVGAAFFAHARSLCMEAELPERLEQLAETGGLEHAAQLADSREAHCCLRMENLIRLRLLMEKLDWQLCFERLSAVEEELLKDAVYATMEDASRAQARNAVAELASALRIEEAALARIALGLAGEHKTTACFYLMEDAGRDVLRRSCGAHRRLRRRIPDPTGKRTAAVLAAAFVVVLALCCKIIGAPVLWINAVPLAWGFVMQLAGRLVPLFVRPKPLPKLELKEIPDDARTLVALPVLLSSPDRAREMAAQMESLGCLERDENIDFLLLGDFRDADSQYLPDDTEIADAAREGIACLNRRAGREKYFYLHRGRSYRERDARWMGEGRKRGAITALNRLLLGREDGACFTVEAAAAGRLSGRYRYVLTLDADTRYLPGTVQKLVGAMLHPLNGKYALLQPCMQPTLTSDVNAYTDLAFASGGMDSYPVSVSELYQDLTGYGNFAGKGIYDVRAFTDATDGVLPDEEILSHDLIEGILSGAAFAGDICLYDGVPDTLAGELSRRHRWTRGDWQLLRVLFSKLPISALERMKMAANLLRSLHAPAAIALLTGAAWLDRPGAFLLGLAAVFADALLHPLDTKLWRRAVLRLAVLPAAAARSMDAILRALWRLFVSRKHLLEWVPAADAGKGGVQLKLYGRISAILLLPGLLHPFWVPGVLALALLFWVGVDRADDLAGRPLDAPAVLSAEHAQLLRNIAAETWHFFATYVPEDGFGLPPDNVQFDPPAGVACRTSPTNIGLYLLSCLSACELGLIGREEMERRMEKTTDTIERLDKWQGNLYNWYDTENLLPLRPRYVSSVDSGNLAAMLLLCSCAAEASLAQRMRCLAENMRLDALYDRERHLFFIGYDVENGCMSQSHYDLYASESRILSYAAMMLGQVPLKHWLRLGRPSVQLGRGQALLSWSGTMFEYLMPELLLHSHALSLAGHSRMAAVHAQMEQGKRLGRPWGVSESGQYAFDLHLNYQYHAFGLPELALNPGAVQDVVAPYAAALALCCAPKAAAENLLEMRRLGWSNAFGMLEAADYRDRREARLVKSCMAHHQGMLLCAVCNALKENTLQKTFMKNPEARALELLLQEKAGKAAKRRSERQPERALRRPTEVSFRRMASRKRICETQLLGGGGTTVLASSHGAAYVRRDRLLLNRFSGDLRSRHDGAYVHLEDVSGGERTVFGASGKAEFDAGTVRFHEEIGGVKAGLALCVSPEDGAFYQQIRLENSGERDRVIAVTGCMAVALAQENDMRAHPVFQNLFVESKQLGNALIFRRRPRDRHAVLPEMIYLCSGETEAETDFEKLVGRTGSLGTPGGIAREFSAATGAVLNPCAALRCTVRVPAGGSVKLHFALAAAQNSEVKLEQLRQPASAERAMQLAEAHARAVLRHCGMDARLYRAANRAAALLADARLRLQLAENHACAACGREALWQAGVSGELPIVLAEVHDAVRTGELKNLLRIHAYWRVMGVETDLVLADLGEAGYRRPVGEGLESCIRASHLHQLRGMPGGVFVLDGQSAGLDAVRRAAALRFDGDADILPQLRRMLDSLHLPENGKWLPMQPIAMERPALEFSNGYGGFDGEDYLICLQDGMLPPAPWSNIIATDTAGAVMTDRGGGFIWRGSSRSGRLTPFANDSIREGWGWMLCLLDEKNRSWMRLLPGDAPMTDFAVRFSPGRCRWEGACAGVDFAVEATAAEGGVEFAVELENTGKAAAQWILAVAVNWLLGTDSADACMLRTWHRGGACYAAGASGVGCLASDDPLARPGCSLQALMAEGNLLAPKGFDALEHSRSGWTLRLPVQLKAGEGRRTRFRICAADTEAEARSLAHDFKRRPEKKQKILRIETPDRGLNLLANGFLPAQVKQARILGRTGLYQPGGAYGFRDQLQDMLPLIYTEPERVRAHLLRCAARQFEDGDVLHWWHEPCTGVRTHISDDLLFLPFVTAQYVSVTGDAGVLEENVPFLEAIEIPEGREDVYAQMQPSKISASLHTHCMRAFNRAARTGEHGLCRMGSGDWNDGMNRVGLLGRGESVWLSQFLAVCAAEYARLLPDGDDKIWLHGLNGRMCAAVEQCGWDGKWYLRAYADDGSILGGRNSACCTIDAISQAWAVFAGLDGRRCASAMDAAWSYLADEKLKLIRLLTPPFDGAGFDPGYIAAYPPGIRENGAQYSHAACWLALAFIRMGDEKRAHQALRMLLPLNHALTKEEADIYRVEPYVMAADIYTHPLHPGRGGWTWYTGSAAWLLMAVYALLGFEKKGNHVRLHALLGDWEQASLTMEYGASSYELVCRRDTKECMLDGQPVEGWVELRDDGKRHRAVFPPRRTGCKAEESPEIQAEFAGKK